MIAHIRGIVTEYNEMGCIISTNSGVGYEVFLPTHTSVTYAKKGEPIEVYTCHIVREDAQELFGFETWDERQTFIILISISKVGARTALNILSTFRPNALRQCVLEEDVLALTKVSGIGKKTAQHIFLELKYKLKGNTEGIASLNLEVFGNSIFRDVILGLQGLGYKEEECAPIVKAVLQAEPDLDVSSALRACLKQLAKGK